MHKHNFKFKHEQFTNINFNYKHKLSTNINLKYKQTVHKHNHKTDFKISTYQSFTFLALHSSNFKHANELLLHENNVLHYLLSQEFMLPVTFWDL